MISDTVTAAINEQIKNELESAYIYLSMAAYLDQQNLPGMAHWMRVQVHEETMHVTKLSHHVTERGGTVVYSDLAQLGSSFASVQQVWAQTLEHEQHITGCIHKLMKLVRDECDFAAEGLIGWFVSEQTEEEANTGQICEDVKTVKDNPQGLLMLDRELAARAFPAGSCYDPASVAAGA